MKNKELVELCKRGNEQALGLLYKTYADKMLKICSYYVTDKQVAQDILHDGFIVIISSIHSLRSSDKLENWMGKIMRNLSLCYLEQHSMEMTIPLDKINIGEEPIDCDYTEDFPPYDTMLQLIGKLPEGYREIFRLSVLEGLSHKEISSLLHIAPHSSSSQLSRAKEMLRKLLSRYRMIGILVLLSVLSLYISRDEKDKSAPKEQAKTDGWRNGARQIESPFYAEDTITPDISSPTIFRQAHDEHVVVDAIRDDNILPCPDSIMEGKDKSSIATDKKENKYRQNTKGNLDDNMVSKCLKGRRNTSWMLSISYSGATGQTSLKRNIAPGSIISKETIEESHHRAPVIFSLSAQKRITARWGIETGIRYTLLRSEFTSNDGTYLERKQRIHYMGIPLKGNYNIWENRKFSVYTSAGLTLDIPIKASVEESLFDNGQVITREKHDLRPSSRWSTSIGIGLRYQITPLLGIYVEPNLNYYFNAGDGIKTINT